ncbi:guanine deaminase [Deinococcus sonorensis]|uniref:Guanine deaminase n=2 Tax=Deinococcus sonorensis TaxID=309891 RepID=A0AAU7UFI7_9DEIO
MTDLVLYRSALFHTPGNPFTGDVLQTLTDGGVAVQAGRILATGDFAEVRAAYPAAPVHDLRGGVLLPGLVDTHVHYPQLRVLGGLGMPLLEWLDRNTLPEEARLSDRPYARELARDFLGALAAHGTTTALVFGSHYRSAMEEFFDVAGHSGLRIASGLVLSDRLLRPELHTTPEAAFEESRALIRQFHGRGRLRYAVTPRFSLSASEGILEACGALMHEAEGVHFTSHLNENVAEIEAVRDLFPWAQDYLDTYDRYGLVSRASVFAHNIHPSGRELSRMAAAGCTVSHCPCSNSALGSGLFPLRRHLEAGVPVALGTDVGGGTGFSLFKEGLQALFMQQLTPPEQRAALTPAHLLYLATLAGAQALGLQDEVGDFRPGKAFDAVLIRPQAGTPLDILMRHADNPGRVLAGLFTLSGAADVRQVWVEGETVHQPREHADA